MTDTTNTDTTTPTIHSNTGPVRYGLMQEGDTIYRTSATAVEAAAHGKVDPQEGFDTSADFRKAAGIDWTYALEPCTRQLQDGTVQTIPNRNWPTIIMPSGNTRLLPGAMPLSDSYAGKAGVNLLQLEDLDMLMDACKGEGVQIDRMGVFGEGAVFWSATRTPEHDRKGPRGLSLEARGLLINGWGGKTALRYAETVTLPVCRNTLNHALDGASRTLTMRHTTYAKDRLKTFVEILHNGDYFDAACQYLYGLDKQKISIDEVATFAKELFLEGKVEEDMGKVAQSNLQEKVDTFVTVHRTAPGAVQDTMLGLEQALTFTSTHLYTKPENFSEFSLATFESTQLGAAQAFQEAGARQLQRLYVQRTS